MTLVRAKGSTRSVAWRGVLGVAAGAGILAGVAWFLGGGMREGPDAGGSDGSGRAAEGPAAAAGALPPELRADYLRTKVTLADVRLTAASVPGADAAVPGLLAVQGEVTNAGEYRLSELTLVFSILKADGAVRSTYFENLAARPIQPGEVRAFVFRIPAGSGSGAGLPKFSHRLK